MDTAVTKIKSGLADILIMVLLSQNDMYGYELAKELKASSNGIYDFSVTVIYPILRALERNRLISSYTLKVGLRRTRQYYHMEPAGVEALKLALGEYRQIIGMADDIMAVLGVNSSVGKLPERSDDAEEGTQAEEGTPEVQ